MAQWLKVLTVLAEDPSSVTSTHIKQFATTCTSNSGDLTPSSSLCRHRDTHGAQTYI